jgi:hypothetical protein
MHTSKKIVAGIGGLALIAITGLALSGCTIATQTAGSTATHHSAAHEAPKAAAPSSAPSSAAPAASTASVPAAVPAVSAAGASFLRQQPAAASPTAVPAVKPAAPAQPTPTAPPAASPLLPAPEVDGWPSPGGTVIVPAVANAIVTIAGTALPNAYVDVQIDLLGGFLRNVNRADSTGHFSFRFNRAEFDFFCTGITVTQSIGDQQSAAANAGVVFAPTPPATTPPASTPPATPSTPVTPPAAVLPLALTTATAAAPLTLLEGSTTPQTITGAGPAGALVTVEVLAGDGSTIMLGTPTVAADGTWAVDFDASSYADGSYTINASTPTEMVIGQINILPDAPVITAVDEGPAGDLEPIISGTALPDASITITGTDASGNPAVAAAAADASGNWSVTLPQDFQPGNGLTATQTDDGYGLTSASVAVTAPVLAPLTVAIDGDNLDISDGTPGATVEVAQDGLNPTRTEVTLGADGTATTPATVTSITDVELWVADPSTGRLGMLITG